MAKNDKNKPGKIVDPPPQGLSNRARTILIAASGGIGAYGVALQLQDADDIGADDEIAKALQITATVFRRAATSKAFGRNELLRSIADGIYTELGIPVPEDLPTA